MGRKGKERSEREGEGTVRRWGGVEGKSTNHPYA